MVIEQDHFEIGQDTSSLLQMDRHVITMDRHQSEVEEEMENTRMIAQCKDWIASEVRELPEGCWLYKGCRSEDKSLMTGKRTWLEGNVTNLVIEY